MNIKKYSLLRSVYADSINTVVNTATGLAGGDAVILPNHVRIVYSKDIEFKALPIMRFAQFARVKTELGTQPGLTIQMMTYNNLNKGGVLTEGVRMGTQALSSTMKSLTVGERGNAVAVSELALKASFTDIMADATTLLARDMALVLDIELRDTALTTTFTIFGRATAGVKIAERAEILAANYLSTASIKDAVEILATNNAPKFMGNYYICFIHPHQSRVLRDDLAWIEASKYGAPDQLFTGEIGRIDDVRFIETTLMPNGACGVADPAYDATLVNAGQESAVGLGDGVHVFKAIVFGEDFYAYAVGLPVELRDNGVTDFGREHALAWYAIWGAGLLHLDRGVVIETA